MAEDTELNLDIESILQQYGSYPTHKAAELGHISIIKILLQSGYSANETNYDCLTPLHEACIHGQVECTELLINCGSTVNAASIDSGTPLCDACAAGSVECVRILMSHGAQVNPPLVLTTPLHEACMKGSLDCAAILINAGARLDVNDCNFGPPLHAATIMNHSDCVRLLLEAGAHVNITKIHQTALHLAASNNNLDIGHVLLEYGANVFARNNQNKRPKDLLPELEGSFYELLTEYEVDPPSLRDCCRRLIRAHLGAQRLQFVKTLQLPEPLLRYILHLL